MGLLLGKKLPLRTCLVGNTLLFTPTQTHTHTENWHSLKVNVDMNRYIFGPMGTLALTLLQHKDKHFYLFNLNKLNLCFKKWKSNSDA